MAPKAKSEEVLKMEKLIQYQFGLVLKAANAEARAEEIRKLKYLLGRNNGVVSKLKFGSAQEDATELLGPLFDVLYTDLPISLTSDTKPKDKPDLKPSQRVDPASTIELAIERGTQPIKVSQLYGEFTKEENLVGENQIAFEKTDVLGMFKADGSKKLTVSVNNDVEEIAVTIKRFEQDFRGARTKIATPVTLDDIELPIANPPEGSLPTKIFEATAFIVHQGALGGGHYTAYVKEADGWYCYNDSLRSTSPVSDVALKAAQADAYVVKYSDKSKSIIAQPQLASKNLGNTCWANSALAFAGSFNGFQGCKEAVLTEAEQTTYREITGAAPTVIKAKKPEPKLAKKTYANYAEAVEAFIRCFENFGNKTDDIFFGYNDEGGHSLSFFYDKSTQKITSNSKELSQAELEAEIAKIQASPNYSEDVGMPLTSRREPITNQEEAKSNKLIVDRFSFYDTKAKLKAARASGKIPYTLITAADLHFIPCKDEERYKMSKEYQDGEILPSSPKETYVKLEGNFAEKLRPKTKNPSGAFQPYGARFEWMHFQEIEGGQKIFGTAYLLNAKFNNCVFDGVDFSDIPEAVRNSISFKGCVFTNNCKPEGIEKRNKDIKNTGLKAEVEEVRGIVDAITDSDAIWQKAQENLGKVREAREKEGPKPEVSAAKYESVGVGLTSLVAKLKEIRNTHKAR